MDANRLKVLLSNESGAWVVQCLQFDLAAQGTSPKEALEAFNWTYWAQVLLDKRKGIKPLSKLPQAPQEYWDRFEKGMPFATGFELKPPFSLDDTPSVAEDLRLAAA